MEVQFTSDQQAQLVRLAVAQGRETEALVQEAVERLLSHNEWSVREVEKGIAAGRGEFVDHDEVLKSIASIDWSRCPAVESVPGKMSGAWVFRDTRLPVATVIENLEDLSVEEVMEQFDVTREQIVAVLEFVAQSLKTPRPPQTAELANAHSL